jgi:heme oxygenase
MQLTDELKAVTETAHVASEKTMVLALKRIRTEEDYIQMLNRLYGFYAPLETLIKKHLTENNFPGISKRSRADNIVADIQALGKQIQSPEFGGELPTIDSYGRALGALYVLEGSTLGGRIIAAMINRQLDTTKGLSFFTSYGAETENMWQSFKDFLNQPRPSRQREEIIAAAKDTFITFKNFIDKHELQPQL